MSDETAAPEATPDEPETLAPDQVSGPSADVHNPAFVPPPGGEIPPAPDPEAEILEGEALIEDGEAAEFEEEAAELEEDAEEKLAEAEALESKEEPPAEEEAPAEEDDAEAATDQGDELPADAPVFEDDPLTAVATAEPDSIVESGPQE